MESWITFVFYRGKIILDFFEVVKSEFKYYKLSMKKFYREFLWKYKIEVKRFFKKKEKIFGILNLIESKFIELSEVRFLIFIIFGK